MLRSKQNWLVRDTVAVLAWNTTNQRTPSSLSTWHWTCHRLAQNRSGARARTHTPRFFHIPVITITFSRHWRCGQAKRIFCSAGVVSGWPFAAAEAKENADVRFCSDILSEVVAYPKSHKLKPWSQHRLFKKKHSVNNSPTTHPPKNDDKIMFSRPRTIPSPFTPLATSSQLSGEDVCIYSLLRQLEIWK